MRTPPIADHRPSDTSRRPPGWLRRARARLFATRLDRDLDAGLPVVAGTVRAVHADRIISSSERHRLAGDLQSALIRAHREMGSSPQIPLWCRHILADAELLGQIVYRLNAAQPVRPRGMARLRLLLTDHMGPLYCTGSGSLAAQLRGVIAAL